MFIFVLFSEKTGQNSKRLKMTNLITIKAGGKRGRAAAPNLLAQYSFEVYITEMPHPTAISRGVMFCEAIYDMAKEVEEVMAKPASSAQEVPFIWIDNKLPTIEVLSSVDLGINAQTPKEMAFSILAEITKIHRTYNG